MGCNLCGAQSFHTIEKSGQHLVICKECGLIFFRNLNQPAILEELYTKKYHRIIGQDVKEVDDQGLRRNKGYLEWIKKHSGRQVGLKLLEVGCSSGALLELLGGEQFQIWGIEPSEHAVEYARRKRGLGCIENCFLSQTQYADNFFDIVILMQTFEHFRDPSGELFKIRGLLKDNGLLFIEVPDAFSVSGVYRWGLEPSANHLFIYTAASIRSLLNKCGFEVVSLNKFKLNIRVVAKKTGCYKPKPQKYRSNYRALLMVSYLNKRLLWVVYRLNIAGKILNSRIFRRLYGS